MKYEEVVGTTKVTNIARYFGLSYSAIYRWLKEDLHKSINRGVVFMTESDLSYIGDKVTSSLKKESLGRTVGSADGCSYIRSFVKESEYELKRANI